MPQKILLVDDSHDELDLLEMYLYNEYEIFTAMNGFEALKTAEQEVPDLIITDIMMPVMDGIRFFNNLKKQPKTANIPVIAVTSFAKKITKKSLMNMGFNGVLAKPLEKEPVIETIQTILNRITQSDK
jgi:CheY-like chemotaxis protein